MDSEINFNFNFFTTFSEMIVSFFNGLLDLKKVFVAGFAGSIFTMIIAILIKPNTIFQISFFSTFKWINFVASSNIFLNKKFLYILF